MCMIDIMSTEYRYNSDAGEKMKHIKNKLLLIMILLSILPMLLIGTVSYLISVNALQNKINNASLLTLGQINRNVEAKVEKVQKYMDIFFTSEKIQKTLAEVDFVKQTADTYMAYFEMDPMISSLFYNDSDVKWAAIFSYSGGQYMYKGYMPNAPEVRQYKWFKDIESNSGKLEWVGIIDNTDRLSGEKKVFAAGRVIKDTAYKKNILPLGVAVIFLREDFLADIYRDVELGPMDTVLITDADGTLLTPSSDNDVNVLSQYSFKDKISGKTTGSFYQKVQGTDMMVTFYTSQKTGWKIIHMVPYSYYVREIRMIGWIILFMAILCLVVIWILSYSIAVRISNPLKRLAKAMNEVGGKNFTVSVPVVTKDEVGLICSGFNSMVTDIRQLFNTVIEEEKEKRRINLMSLQYQINPHFLYNTLSSVRFLAIADKSDNVAEMILVLSRLLRNTINKVGKMIKVSEELKNLKDYVFLQQIRYKNRIVVDYDVDEEIMNYKMPGMLLQPLVENAIEHGLSSALAHNARECRLKISAARVDDQQVFEIWDNGKGMTEKQILDVFNDCDDGMEDKPAHIGIKNIHDRLRFQFGPGFGISISSVPEEYTSMKLNLPVQID